MSAPAPKKSRADLTVQSFAQLLAWLDPDPQRAGGKYEQIRRGLIKIFLLRGCVVPEELADETINRVAAKLPEIAAGYVGEPAPYFYSVADKIYLEYMRTESSRLRPLPADVAAKRDAGRETELKYQCLEECMRKLPAQSRELIRAYYYDQPSGKAKADKKQEMADTMRIARNALWLKAYRIREGLKRCMTTCLQSGEMNPGPS